MREYLHRPMALRRDAMSTPERAARSDNGLGLTRTSRMKNFAEPSPQPPASVEDPPLNIGAALARLGGARQLLNDLATFFLEDAPQHIQKLKRALATGDAFEAERMAHSIKGLAATFDGHPTSRAAFEIEKLASAGDLTGAGAALPRLEAEVQRLRQALTEMIADKTA